MTERKEPSKVFKHIRLVLIGVLISIAIGVFGYGQYLSWGSSSLQGIHTGIVSDKTVLNANSFKCHVTVVYPEATYSVEVDNFCQYVGSTYTTEIKWIPFYGITDSHEEVRRFGIIKSLIMDASFLMCLILGCMLIVGLFWAINPGFEE